MTQKPMEPGSNEPRDTDGERALELIAGMAALGDSLTGSPRPETVVERIALAIEDTFHPSRSLIVLYDFETNQHSVAWARGYSGDPDPDGPLVRLVLSEGAVVSEQGSSYWMGAPIVAVGQRVGVVCLESAPGQSYSRSDLDGLRALVSQASVALQNARLFRLLSEGKREWEYTVDSIRQAICVIDCQGIVRRANLPFSKLVRAPVTACSGLPWDELVPEPWKPALARILSDFSAEDCELTLGERTYVATAMPTGDTEALTVLVLEDSTDRRALQDQLVQSAKMSAIGQLIAGVAHDLNNPLASIVGLADYLSNGGIEIPGNLEHPLGAIHQEAERAAGIVRNLLSFARKQDRQRVQVDIADILESTLALLNNQLMQCNVVPELIVEDDVPMIGADPGQVQQVFLNLVHNAAQAIEFSGTGSRISIRASRWLDGVAVTVSDDGPGIPEEIARRVFEPFFTTRADGGGTGLGLSICQGIITEHGGKISLLKQGDAGATFRVELPGVEAVGEEAEPEFEADGDLSILVVDDEPHILYYMRATLEEWGHRVAVAGDGRKALNLVRQRNFDLIICDLRMPKLGGRELYEQLCGEAPDKAERVFFSTGDTVRDDTLQFLESLQRPFLKKPFKLTDLRHIVGRAVGAAS